jgi:molecular chaperone Hsp33
MTKTARHKHHLSGTTTQLLGRAMSAAAAMSSFMKGDERVTLTWRGRGDLKVVYAEASRNGEVRGYVSPANLHQPSSTPLGYALRTGVLSVSQVLYNRAKPYQSMVELAEGDVNSDVEQYFALSEQIPTLVAMETVLNGAGEVLFSGGLLIQTVPQSDAPSASTQHVIDRYRERLRSLSPPSVLFLEETKSLEQLLQVIEPNVRAESQQKLLCDFYCRCSKQRFRDSLITLGPQQLTDVLHGVEQETTCTCQYCNNRYVFSKQELQQLLDQLAAGNAPSTSPEK